MHIDVLSNNNHLVAKGSTAVNLKLKRTNPSLSYDDSSSAAAIKQKYEDDQEEEWEEEERFRRQLD